jgi:hypothetical protein
MKFSNRRKQHIYPYPWKNSVKTEMFRLSFWIDKILHNFDDIFILKLLKLLHLRKIKPITSLKNMLCSVDCSKLEWMIFADFSSIQPKAHTIFFIV